MKSNWVKITESNAPQHKVLVTNNIDGKEAGQMSHVWIAETGVNKKSKGRYSAFIDLPGKEEVHDITHFCEIPQ